MSSETIPAQLTLSTQIVPPMLLAVATRLETAAMTRRSLLEAAGALLDAGGPEAVTLREVGARTGLSRSAPYRHFANKETLLTVLATNALSELGEELEWGIGHPEHDGTTWYQDGFTRDGAHHHAAQGGDGRFPAWRRLGNWHNATEETP